MKLIALFFLCSLASAAASVSNGIYSFNKITTKEGLSHSTVYTITQDHKGFIWIGSREGLNRYDSYGITTFYSEQGDSSTLSSNVITALLSSSDSCLYIGADQGFNVYDDKKDTFRRIQYNGASIGMVHNLYESSEHAIYICSSNGLFKLDDKKQLTRLMNEGAVLGINEYRKNIFWAVTPGEIIMINQEGEVIRRYPQEALFSSGNVGGNFSCIFKDSEEQIWIGTQRNGLFNYVPKEDRFVPIKPGRMSNPVEANVIKAINEDVRGNIWIGTESGLFIYSKKEKSFSHYSQSFDNSVYALSDKSVYSIYRSRENIMWIGTYFGGVNFVKPAETGFYEIVPDGGKKALSGKAVSEIIKDDQNRFWIATEDGGVTVFDKKKREFQYFTHSVDRNSISSNNVHALQDDGKGNIWIGTLLGGVSRYDLRNRTFQVYKHNPGDPASISHNNVFSILQDSRGDLWFGTWTGVNVYNPAKDNFTKFETSNFSGQFIYDMLEDHEGNIWFCSRHTGLFFYDVKEGTVTHFRAGDPEHGLPSNNIISAYQDSKQRLWFGSLNGGLVQWNAETQKFASINRKHGLPNDNVYGILEDEHGLLWLSSNKGLCRYNPETGEILTFDHSHGILNRQFNFRSFFEDDDGWMYFGSVNGLYYFHPDSLALNHLPADVHFTDFRLFNQPVAIAEAGILKSHINETEEIRLAYEQNVITFEFLAVNYFSPGNDKFSYYLEGFEENWSSPDIKRTATYTNLSPGEYTFHVKAANNDGVWSEGRTIRLVIKPPLWLSSWALVVYGILFILLVYLTRAYIIYRHKERMALHLERLEKEKMKEINQHKLNFFTYISHEFKTPLTLIIASIDRFLNNNRKSEEDTQEFQLIRRYAKRLHFLIEQLLEFRKVESEHATLDLGRGDMICFLRDTFSAFIPLFSKKNIEYQFRSDADRFVAFFDADKLDKIVTNLVSNAVKHTPDRGKICMEINIIEQKQQADPCIRIKVTDTGAGLTEGEADKIFSPFYQSPENKLNAPGSGVGLALVKSLIDFLKGRIHVESNVNTGTSVAIELPCSLHIQNEQPLNEQSAVESSKHAVDEDLIVEENDSVAENETDDAPESSPGFDLMIVEDNPDLLKFLVNHFSGLYKVVSAKNGREALDKIKKSMPDMIISDVMMPFVDGITLCEKIKSDLNTSHIPFILLSARSSVPHKLEGLDVGADAYVPKPFNLKELELLVKNTLESRNNLKMHFLKHGHLNGCDAPMNNRDQLFINKLTDIVHQFIDNPEFDITTFTREAGISRTLLHLKLKKLVNLNASDFIKTIRLQKAAKLLKEGLTVSEVAFQVGFKDPNYFSRSFKKKYDVTPSDFRAHTETMAGKETNEAQ